MKKSNAGRIVSYILIVMVIVVAIGVCAHFTDGFESEFKTFYATVKQGCYELVRRVRFDSGKPYVG